MNSTTIVSLIIAAGLAFIPANIAKSKGRSFGLWWLYGWLLFIVALIHSLLLKDDNSQKSSSFENTSVSSQKSSPKATTAIIVAILVAFGGFFAVRIISTSMENKNEQLVYTEYAQACNELESSILSSSECKEAKVNSIDFEVDSVEKINDEYIATVTAHCKTSAHYSNKLEKELDGVLVAYEIVNQIPSNITLSNGKRATLFNNTRQVYVYVNGEMVYYPGYRYS